MKHSPFLKVGLFMTMFVSFLCCTHEEDSVWKDVVDKEVQSFFNVEDLHSRTNELNADLIRIVVSTLQKQNNLLEAIREYKSQYGSPMWLYSKCISTPNGLQIFVPVYNKNYPDEIKAIWHFGIYNNILYHFTRTRKPEYTLVEEFWKFDYFTVYALGKEPASGLRFHNLNSRAEYECEPMSSVTASIVENGVEYSYTDVKEWHCWPVGEDEYLQDITDPNGGGGSGGGFDSGIPIDDGFGNGGGDIGGDGSSNSGSSIAPKAQEMFRNSNMTEQNWKVIEKMLDKITENCMGENLYNALLEKLNGNKLIIQFSDKSSSFDHKHGNGININIDYIQSNHLFHEMWHAYQAYQETVESFEYASLNLEIEAHYAQFLYLEKLPEYPNSKWQIRYYSVKDDYKRHKSIADLRWYVNSKGEFNEGFSNVDLNFHMTDIVEYFHKTDDYKYCKFDESRNNLSMFRNLNVLTKGC